MDESLSSAFSGVMSDGSDAKLAFTKLGLGTLTLSGSNTYSGGTILTAGVLALGANNSLPTAGALLINGSELSLGIYSNTLSALSITSGSVMGSGTLSPSNYTLSPGQDSVVTMSTVISGDIQLIKSGAGTLVLTADNTYTGGTVLLAGTLSLASANAISTSGRIDFAGGTLQFTSVNTTDYSARFGTTQYLSQNQQYSFDTNGEDVSFDSELISAGSSFTKLGAGTLTMTDISRFIAVGGSATVINGGSLVLPVAHPTDIPVSAAFSGTGILALEPISTSFTAAVTSSTDLLFDGSAGLGAITVGKQGNTVAITVDGLPSNIVGTGSQSYYGGTITVPSTANSTITAWSTGGILTLSAQTNVVINASISVTGTGGVAIETSQSSSAGNTGNYHLAVSASGFASTISFDGTEGQTFTTHDGSAVSNLKSYTLISSLSELADATLSDHYALMNDVDALLYVITDVNGNTSNYGNVLIGDFTGTFTGLGHTIANLALTKAASHTGIFETATSAIIRDLVVDNATILGRHFSGTLIGRSYGTTSLSGLLVTNGDVSLSGNYYYTGGLVGYTDAGTLTDVWSINTPVTGHYMTGGLIGRTYMVVDNAHNIGSDITVTGNHYTGGLFGQINISTTISDSDSTGTVTSNQNYVGGLVGNFYYGEISNSFATGDVSGSNYVGGLLGSYDNTPISDSYATGDVSGANYVGGLIGYGANGNILTDVYATGDVTGAGEAIGGLIGKQMYQITLKNSSASGTISGNHYVGGLIGHVAGNHSGAWTITVDNSYFNGPSLTAGASVVGGLIGRAQNPVTIKNASYVDTTTISGSEYAGGLIGLAEQLPLLQMLMF